MIPMERSRIFKILTEIFRDTKWEDVDVVPYVMKEDAAVPHDINFVRPRPDNTHLNGYRDIDYWLRIIDPRDDCPEYNLVLHSAISDKDANITIDGTGNFRVYGDYINSFVYRTIKNNIQKFCDYAVELTELESRQAFEHVFAIINTYTNELMDIHAGEFVQRDVIPRDDYCTNFVLKKTPYLWNALGVDVLRNFHKECVPSNDVWIRFYFDNSSCTPIMIYPFRHEVKLEGDQLEKLTGGVITMKECVRIAERIAKDLEYFVTTDSGNTWVKKAIGDFNTTHKLCDEPGAIIDSIVEKVVVITQDWIEIMMHQGVFHSYVCDCGDNLFTLSNNRRVRILYLTDEIRVQIDGETVIKVTTRNKNWKVCLVLTIDHILKDNKPFTLHQITCLADMIREKLGIEHLYLNDTDRVLEKTSEGSYTVTDSNGKGLREFFCGVRKPKPNAPEKVIEEHVDKSPEEINPSMCMTSKDYLTNQILSQLKSDWQKNVYISVYSSVWCTLVESRFKSAAFELEKHFMEYVTLDNDECFTVRFGLQRIDDNLPGIEINFYSATQEIVVRMLDHKASGSGTWSRPLIRVRPSYESIVYFDKIKNTNCAYKSFLANVVSKIVLLEGLS